MSREMLHRYHVKNSQPLKRKLSMVSEHPPLGYKKGNTQTRAAGDTSRPDHPVSTQKERVQEAKPSSLGISAYQTKFGE